MMERRLYRELWKIRFDKMLQLEDQSVLDYQKLLEECKTKYKGHSLEPHLGQLIKDEKKHSLLCKELLAILERQTDQG